MVLEGKVAIVTGASASIGREIALTFAREGAAGIVVVARREADGQETVRQVEALGGRAVFVRGDVATEQCAIDSVAAALSTYGQLDVLVNNAGLEQIPQPLTEQTIETFDRIMDVNVKAVWFLMRQAIPAMLENGGAIVNLASAAGVRGTMMIPIYAASKHGVIGLSKSVALEFAARNIRVNVVCPGSIAGTEMLDRFVADRPDALQKVTSLHPLGRLGRVEDIAEAVVWLASEKSAFITGDVLMVEGGSCAGSGGG